MVVKPIVPQGHALLSQMSNCELSALPVAVIAQDHIWNLDNYTCLIRCTINIIDWDQNSEGASGDIIWLHPFNIDETASCTTVDEGLCASPDCCVCWFDLYVDGK
jgi:hypothetical protein